MNLWSLGSALLSPFIVETEIYKRESEQLWVRRRKLYKGWNEYRGEIRGYCVCVNQVMSCLTFKELGTDPTSCPRKFSRWSVGLAPKPASKCWVGRHIATVLSGSEEFEAYKERVHWSCNGAKGRFPALVQIWLGCRYEDAWRHSMYYEVRMLLVRASY